LLLIAGERLLASYSPPESGRDLLELFELPDGWLGPEDPFEGVNTDEVPQPARWLARSDEAQIQPRRRSGVD